MLLCGEVTPSSPLHLLNYFEHIYEHIIFIIGKTHLLG